MKMNTRITIKLNDFSKAKKFINEVVKFESDVDAVKGRYIVDAKSIVGIFTLDLSKPITVVLHSDNIEEVERFNKTMEEFTK